MRDPNELITFGKADELSMAVYRLTAERSDEWLGRELRRRASAVPVAIAEACGWWQRDEWRRGMQIAAGKALALRCQLSVARRLGYGTSETLFQFEAEAMAIAEALSRLCFAGPASSLSGPDTPPV